MFYKKYLKPRLFLEDPEEIHDRVLKGLSRVGNTPLVRTVIKKACTVHDKRLEQTLFGMTFPNPVGLAAGMDKDGVALRGFEMLGFGFIEMGGITAMTQYGKPKPRIFRVPEDEALINRMGFNNLGAENTAYRLRSTPLPKVPLAINIGKSKNTPVEDMDAVIHDYCYTFRLLYPYASFFVVNVSSPNTPGLRGLQEAKFLKALLQGIMRQNLKMPRRPGERLKPLLIKIAPDLSLQEIDEIPGVIKEVGCDGIVATNTTLKRAGLKTNGALASEEGGLSGKPLFPRALEIVGHIHKKLPTLPIIGVGGIFSGEDAHQMILAGASLVQIYTALVYEGPGLPRRINSELLRLMERDGIGSMSEWRPEINRS